MQIKFTVVKESTGNSKELVIKEDEYLGEYVVKTLTAQEGINGIDELTMENEEYRENPERITVNDYRKKMIEKATTRNGKPIGKIDLKEMPHKLWQILVAANEKLNGLSDAEARFLLEPSYGESQPNIPP